ncbi:MAG TPA: phage portal protein, partial [Thermoanaerobaculales bacterium]|nr:phage portal protein [Thermoanaerobaculales bacterium]
MAAPQTDLARAFAALSAKRSRIDRLFAYYDGEQPLRYSTARLQQAFARIDAKFSENWCATVVDSLVDRLALTGFALRTDQAAQDVLDTIWQQEHLEIETDDVAEDVAVCGESFVIVGRDEDGLTRVVHNDPRVC